MKTRKCQWSLMPKDVSGTFECSYAFTKERQCPFLSENLPLLRARGHRSPTTKRNTASGKRNIRVVDKERTGLKRTWMTIAFWKTTDEPSLRYDSPHSHVTRSP